MAAVEPGLASALGSAGSVALLTARGAEREFLALARAKTFLLSGRSFTIVGGVAVDEAFLARLARDRAIIVVAALPWGDRRRSRERPDSRTTPPSANSSCR